ncbi:MAG: excinuclease ABC subunit UvrA [Verrucomicrobiia bacterium]|jgi:excinuclease ABC subunit A
MAKEFIRIGGARQHNLKNISLEIPRDKLVVITGVSGSGKSSLAFDTIYAEGQRKYVESLSTYARQFLDQMEKPDVDYIDGLSPAIAIEQRSSGSNPRSIIATTTEIYDYLRLLYAHIGQPHCPESGLPISSMTPTDITDKILSLPSGSRIILLAPIVKEEKGEFRDVIERLSREGFVRARIDDAIYELSINTRIKLDPDKKHTIEVVVDRLVIDDRIRPRLSDSVETALKWGKGTLLVLYQNPTDDPKNWNQAIYSTRLFSPATGKSYEPVTPKHFSFNAPLGACPVCHGLGQKLVFDPALIVPDENKSLEQGAILPWKKGDKRMANYYQSLLKGVAAHYKQRTDTPYKNLPESFKNILLYGSGDTQIEFIYWRAGKLTKMVKPFEGVIPNLNRLYEESQSESTKNKLKAFMNPHPCDACNGKRLKPEILAVTLTSSVDVSGSLPENRLNPKVPGLSIMDFCALSVEKADEFLANLNINEFQRKIAADIIKEIRARLGFLKNVGLGYLTLDRESGTLSGGEAQRIRLATQIGAGLVGVLYILDEPSIGLHQRDNEKLLQTMKNLRDIGNSVIVVEHDEDTIRSADYIIDLGPGAGVNGGEVVACGTLEDILKNPRSLTAKYLNGELSIPIPLKRIKPCQEKGWLQIIGASENNLKNINVHIPLGTLTCVTGVSGSGKSTLVDTTLRRALFRMFYGSKEPPGKYKEILGTENIDKVIVIDQSPIGRTPRSNPATYTGMFNHIRDLFAKLPAAKIRGYDASRFSFNVRGGRCEKCQGDGLIKIEMHFLPPVYVTCEACNGKRYNRETLEIHYKGLNIADVLNLTIDEAVTFFRSIPQIYEICLTLSEVGLGYLKLGQSGTTLSGGESQRLKLAAELSRKSTGRTLYILDEPTTGLHFHDVSKLLEVLFKLRAMGNTLIVIEHNLDVIKCADWIIDLGPEGGENGGFVVAEGSPEEIASCDKSYTGFYLKRVLQPGV